MATSDSLAQLLARLEQLKRRFDPEAGVRANSLLATLASRRFADAESLIRFHEALLFLRAYPQNAKVLRRTDELLLGFGRRVVQLRRADADLSPFEEPEVSGIAGTGFSAILSYDVVRRLVELHAGELEVDWESYEVTDRLAPAWRRLFPLIEEDTLVEAVVPYVQWLRAATGRTGGELAWLLRRLEELPLTQKDKAELYGSLELPVRWELRDSQATRSRMRLPARKIFYHDEPLIPRKDVSLAAELESPPFPLETVSRAQGEALLDMTRETSATRYRELHGFTYGDPERVRKADFGRGVEVFLSGVPPERRLPLRAYHAAFFVKNGVPIGYFEALSLFERMEVGFNLYYTFREGETAWLFARVLRLFRQVLGVTCFSVDPYQIGYHNEEAIESGAFWFYRKLGFRPVRPEVANLAEAEEKKLRKNTAYRTPSRTLRRLATGHMIYETPGTERGDWDRFSVRNLGLAVQRRMAEQHRGNARGVREAAAARVASALEISPGPHAEFENLALVLTLIPDLARWTAADKRGIVDIIRAKMGPDESQYLHLMQRHAKLREAVIRLGS